MDELEVAYVGAMGPTTQKIGCAIDAVVERTGKVKVVGQ